MVCDVFVPFATVTVKRYKSRVIALTKILELSCSSFAAMKDKKLDCRLPA